MELILSLITGGATGILGSAIGKFFGFLKVREERKTQRVNNAHIERLHELNMSARGQELESEERIAGTAAAAKMQEGSYRHDASYGQVAPWAATVLRLVRPVLTFSLVALTLTFWLSASGDDLVDANALKTQIVSTTLYLTTVAITWWFGDRAPDWAKPKR